MYINIDKTENIFIFNKTPMIEYNIRNFLSILLNS